MLKSVLVKAILLFVTYMLLFICILFVVFMKMTEGGDFVLLTAFL